MSERILAVQLADIGDLVLTTPALAALREARPAATIDLLAAAHALPLLPRGLVDNTLPFQRAGISASRALLAPGNWPLLLQIARRRYDALILFHHFTLRGGMLKFRLIAAASGARRILGLQNGAAGFLTDSVADAGFGARHQAQYWLDLVALLGADKTPRPAKVQRQPFPLPAADSHAPLVVMHAGSGGYSPARRWDVARFADLARRLRKAHDAQIVIVGQRGDDGEALAAALDFPAQSLVGRTSLPQLADVMARAQLFVGADSGVMHLAAAAGAPVLGIFGPSNAEAWRPWTPGGLSAVLRSGVACSPCSYVGREIGAREGCPARTCMKLVSSAQAAAAANDLLAGRQAGGIAAPATATGANKRVSLLGVPIDAVTYGGWLARIDGWIRDGGAARQVCTVNPEFIMIAQGDSIFRHILQRAALCVPDGAGLLWACRRIGFPLPERVTGSDGLPLIARTAAERSWRLYLLGAAPGIAKRAAEILLAQHPALQIAGIYAGSPAADEEDDIVARINASGADILFVAYGAPQQDKWIARNLPRLQVSMAMGVGGSLDFIAGAAPRAPLWLRKRGLEWLYRLLRQPWRWRRMLRLPRFVIAVLRAPDVHWTPEAKGRRSDDVGSAGG